MRHMSDREGTERWLEVLEDVGELSTTLEEQLERDLDALELTSEMHAGGYAASRDQMSRAGTGGDPLRSRTSGAYDDIDPGQKTTLSEVGRDDDFDILVHDDRAWSELRRLGWDMDEPDEYTWSVTQQGYVGTHPEYDDITWDGGQWLVGGRRHHDFIESVVRGVLSEDDDDRKRRMRTIRNIRGQLEHVWQMLGKAETKLGVAKFDADEENFHEIEKTLQILVGNVKEIMSRIEAAREKMELT